MNGALGRTSGGGPEVVIDAFPSAALLYHEGYAIVVADVIRATTTAITALVTGRRCFTAPTVDAASVLAKELTNPLLAGEMGGNMPFGFDMDNSPHEMSRRTDVERPAVLVTSSGTMLIHNAAPCGNAYAVCLRNISATVEHLAGRHERIAVIGAGSRGEFREEDQMCCAEVARRLMDSGYRAADERTAGFVDKWMHAPPDAWLASNSVRYLLSAGHKDDLDFVVAHRDDLSGAYRVRGAEILAVAAGAPAGSRDVVSSASFGSARDVL